MAVKGITVNTAPEAEPHIYAEDDASIFQSIVGDDGVFDTGQKFAATILSNNKVRIADGVGCIGGHFYRIPYGEYFDAEIVNGQSGYHRNDIIVGKFVTTGTGGIDAISVEVVQGAAAATATDPALTQDDLYSAGKIREVPLYRVKIEGLSIVAVEQMFEIVPTIPGLLQRVKSAEAEISQLNGKIEQMLDYRQSNDFGTNITELYTKLSVDSYDYIQFIVSWGAYIYFLNITAWTLTSEWKEFTAKNLFDGNAPYSFKVYSMRNSGEIKIKFAYTDSNGSAGLSILSLAKHIQLAPFTLA